MAGRHKKERATLKPGKKRRKRRSGIDVHAAELIEGNENKFPQRIVRRRIGRVVRGGVVLDPGQVASRFHFGNTSFQLGGETSSINPSKCDGFGMKLLKINTFLLFGKTKNGQ